jgi:equilibrative nucleoside transporter 1/2/3
MFLAAAPYFQNRFEADPWILENSQSAIISVSTVTNLATTLILTNIQTSASYPFRINAALAINTTVFALLTVTTRYFLEVSTGFYFGFMLLLVSASSLATGLLQNGGFAFAASFGRPEYTQAIMAGQGIAGVLPAVAQMVSVLAVPPESPDHLPDPTPGTPPPGQKSGTSAFVYFLTAVGVSIVAIVAFAPLVRRHRKLMEARLTAQMAESRASLEEAERAARRYVSIPSLFSKLRWVAAAVFMCFVVTMFFPIFTSKVLSVRGDSAAGVFAPPAFIPLGFLCWNLGDLIGRMATMLPFSLRKTPAALFGVSLARILFLALYMLTNIRGRGAVVPSDAFYLLVVQFPFGFTNGWLGSSSMMAAGEWVDDSEREAAGGFMSLCLVAGLTVGSLLSFTAAGI